MTRAVVLSLLLLLAGCDFSVVTGGASGVGTGSGSGSGSGNGGTGTGGGSNPSPNPLPTPSPSPGNRAPDPAQGGVLPFPGYAEGVVEIVLTPLTASSCQSGAYLDAVVFALRSYDTRWGYQCKDPSCSVLSNDRIAYHATAGPDVRGAMGVWTVDIIGAACTTPTQAWQPDGYNASLWFTPSR